VSNSFGNTPPNHISTVGSGFHRTLVEKDSRDAGRRREQCGPVCTFVAILFGVIGILFFGGILAFIVHVWFSEHPNWVW
jgi:predicted GNAT family acetyltransferase